MIFRNEAIYKPQKYPSRTLEKQSAMSIPLYYLGNYLVRKVGPYVMITFLTFKSSHTHRELEISFVVFSYDFFFWLPC